MVKSGSDTGMGGPGDGWVLLTDGALGISVDSGGPASLMPPTVVGSPVFNISALQETGGGGDTELNSMTETLGIWTAIDGGATVPGTVSANATTYGIGSFETDTETVVDYAGGGGNFPTNNAYSTIGGGTVASGGGDQQDFSVRAEAFLAIPEGDYTISVASDDGRRLELDFPGGGFSFLAETGQGPTLAPLDNVIGFNGTTGHDQSVGRFTITSSDLVPGEDYALVNLDSFFFERGGGDSFEIAIARGHHVDFDSTADSFQLLSDGQYGVLVSDTPIEITPISHVTTTDDAVGVDGDSPATTTSTDFGRVRIGTSAAAPESVTVENTGSQTLDGVITAAGGDFSGGPSAPFSLSNGETDSVDYSFSPTAHGPLSDTVTVDTTSTAYTSLATGPVDLDVDVTLDGIGVGPEFNLTAESTDLGKGGLIELSPDPPLLTKTVSVLIENLTPDLDIDTLEDLTLHSFSITGPDADRFMLSGFIAGTTLDALDSLPLMLTFTADGLDSYNATLQFFTDEGVAVGGNGAVFTFQLFATTVPEPATLFIGAFGLFAMGYRRYGQRRKLKRTGSQE